MPIVRRGVIKVADAIRETVVRHVQPLAAAIRPPEILTVISFSGNTGSAVSKSSGSVSIKSKVELVPGMAVVGVPTGPREFYVVGYY